jgi:hypothetical protein
MKFNKLIEGFNVLPRSQNAIQSGPDIGMTTGDMERTFPNRGGAVMGNLLPNEVQIKISERNAKKIYKILTAYLKKLKD